MSRLSSRTSRPIVVILSASLVWTSEYSFEGNAFPLPVHQESVMGGSFVVRA